ncbi:hypothetical protein P879_06299 [Paragonimus westermani]|uniref:Nuclear pore complex protein Nup160 n=1 Tax=Paragonimus westermani TaxID=34504 RepID=A0A8T0DVB0_9TREM|nr:hypothetical protein P879_06299 [Paragonimus westermani]
MIDALVFCSLSFSSGELDETFCSLEPLPFTDPTNWKRLVFSSVSSSKTNVLIAFGKLTDMLEKSEATVNFEGDSFMNDEQTWSSVSKVPTLAIGLVSQSFIQTCETRLKFAFSLLMLASRYHLSPINTEEFSMYEDSNTCENIIARLSRLVRSLRLLLWIGSTRVHSVIDPKKLTIVEDHLSILGLRYSSQVGRPSIEPDQRLQSFSQLPGLTLLEQLCSNWPDCQFCRTINSVDSDTVHQPWTLRCSTLVADLYTTLNSSKNYGRGLLRVFRHLLLGGHAKELITLANLLSVANPPGVSSHADNVDQDFTELYSAETPSWDGDYSLVRLLTGLAHLWLDQPDLAEEDFIQASDWLKCHIQGMLQSRSDLGCLPIAVAPPITFSQTLLLGVLFPGEFSDLQLFCSEESHEGINDHICPEEVQVRFLMKVMPVLEASDCVVQVLRLCEFALNLLAKVHLTPPCTDGFSSSMNIPSSDQHTIKSGRLTSILNNLHACQDEPNEGFLCGPIPKNEPLTGQTAQSLLYSRLSDLEAALWTRMFKHHLALGHYTSAHLLIRSNPDVDRRRDCLRQLIVTLCDRGESSRLVSFHYGASEDEFLLILEARARATDVLPSVVPTSNTVDSASSVNPYYDVLYAFHIRHANYRAAAMILFEHAHRLAEETACAMFSVCSNGFRAGGARLLFGLQRQAACLVAAINALYLVPEEHQWLIRPGSSNAQDAYPSSWIPLGSNLKNDGRPDTELDLDELVEDDWAFADTGDQASSEPVRSSNSVKCQPNTDTVWHEDAILSRSVVKNAPYSQPPTRMALDKQILQLSDLLRLYTLTRARLRLAQVCWEQGMLRAGPVSPLETVHSLLSLALYDFLLILEARARATDVLPSVVPTSNTVDSASSVNPYYDVLYAFHIRHANYRAAAMILFEHAHRLAEETACAMFSVCSNGFRAGGARLLFGLQRQAACLVAAINALYLVPEEHQWLIRPGSSNAQDAYPSSWIPLGSNRKNDGRPDTELDLDELVEDDWAFADTGDQASSEPVRSSNSVKCQPNTDTVWHEDAILSRSVVKNAPYSQPPTRMALDKQILQLSDLLRLYTLTRARLRLAQVCWEQGMLRAGPVSPLETVHSLLSLALYDEAVKVSEQFALNFTPIVDAVASRCAELAQHAAVHPSSTGPQRSVQSGFSQIPSLPGLVTVSAPLSHETDLVTQSLQALAGSAGIHTTSEEVLSGARSQPLGELYWRLLEVILNRLDPATHSVIFQSVSPRQHMTTDSGYLHLLACQRLLQSGPNRLHLPEWLVSRLLCTSARTCRPAGLLRLYLQQDRIVPAYDLVMDMLDAATGVTGADPSAFGLLTTLNNSKSCTSLRLPATNKLDDQIIWLPHNLIVRLLEALRLLARNFPACKTVSTGHLLISMV